MAPRRERQARTVGRATRLLLAAALVGLAACTPGAGGSSPGWTVAVASADPTGGPVSGARTESDPAAAGQQNQGPGDVVMPWSWMTFTDAEALEAAAPGPPPTPTPTPPLPTVAPSIPRAGTAIPADAWRVPVLTYHLITTSPPPTYAPNMAVTPERLDAHLHALQQGGWRTVTAAQASEALSASRRLPPRSIILTFDDGYDDAWEAALPILRRYGYSATFFVLPGRFDVPLYLTTAHARDLAAAGMEVANHTWDHLDLSSLTYAAALDQVVQASDAIQRLTGVRPTTFAYPYGRYNDTAVRVVSAAGLQMAFTTVSDCLEYAGNRLVVPRIRINPWTTVDDLTASLRRCTG